MKLLRMRTFFCLLIALITLLIPAVIAKVQMVKAAPSNCGAWSIVSSPSSGTYDNQLNEVAAISSHNSWAVGYYYNNSANSMQTLIEHWNGTAWIIKSSPNVVGADNELYGIAAISAQDIWAVGVYRIGTGNYNTLTEHWDGTAWKIVSSPNPTSGGDYLNGVTAISANNVWAVGEYFDQNATSETTLIEHWNGTSWNVIPGANPAIFNGLNGVTAISAKDVWAAGVATNSFPASELLAHHDFQGRQALLKLAPSVQEQTLIEHWNGNAWKIVKSPTPLQSASLSGIAGSSANDIWAAGLIVINKTRTFNTLIEHWNCTAWTTVSSPNPCSGNDLLSGVAAISTNNAWVVGYDNNNGTTLIEQWNGTSWSVVSSPNPSSIAILSAVTSIKNTTSLWTVGHFFNSQGATQTLTEFYC